MQVESSSTSCKETLYNLKDCIYLCQRNRICCTEVYKNSPEPSDIVLVYPAYPRLYQLLLTNIFFVCDLCVHKCIISPHFAFSIRFRVVACAVKYKISNKFLNSPQPPYKYRLENIENKQINLFIQTGAYAT